MISTDVILESFRAIVLLVLVGYLWGLGKKKHFIVTTGWKFIQFGFLLILFGSFLDITDNFDSLNPYVIVGDTETEAFLEKVVGYLAGFIFLTIGLIQWGPTVEQLMGEVAERKQAEDALRQTQRDLAGKVGERTAELKEEIYERKQAEKILLESEQRFRGLYHQSPLGITLEDYSSAKALIDRLKSAGVSDFRRHFQDHSDDLKQAIMGIRVLDANDTLIEMYGAVSFDEFHQYEVDSKVWEDSNWRNFYIEELAELAAGNKTFTNEVLDVLPSGSAIELRCISSIIKGHEDDWSEIITTHENITERKKMENILRNIAEGVSGATGKNFFDTLVESLVSALDVDHAFVGKLLESGKAIQTISFFSKNEIAENFEYQLKGTPCENVVGKSLDIYEKGVAERFPEDAALKEMGIEGYAGAPLFDTSNQPLGILVVLSETPLKLQEMVQSLLLIFATRAASELEREIALEKLKGSMSEADKANRAKSEFLANMSHELRTPLNSIIGFSQMLEAETFGPLGSDENREYIEFIHNSGSHLHRLIGDILDLSKIEAGEESLSEENVDISEVVDECLEMISTRSDEKWLSFPVHIQANIPLIYADKLKIIQILLNLLSNAIKFTPESGDVKIQALLNDQGSILLMVQDTGIGISPDDLELVLEPFGQAGETYTRSYDGSGLGLSLVKSLTALHGGTVNIESEVGVGTTVTVCFPPERTVVS